MKKIIILGLSVISILILITNVKRDEIVIPDEAIRLRVIANSDTPYDQSIKVKVKNYMEENISILLKDENNIEDARTIIKDNIVNLETGINNLLEKEKYDLGFTINYGYNYFPEKEYKGITYKSGEYESVVVKLGEGNGCNWWCVLFPPLCLLEAEESDEVEYKFFVQELLDKIF